MLWLGLRRNKGKKDRKMYFQGSRFFIEVNEIKFYESDVALKRRKWIVRHSKYLHTLKHFTTLLLKSFSSFRFASRTNFRRQFKSSGSWWWQSRIFHGEVCGVERNAIKKFISSHNDDRKTVNRREISKKMKKEKFCVNKHESSRHRRRRLINFSSATMRLLATETRCAA